ncbi:hypothetical protein [Vagococcus martis]
MKIEIPTVNMIVILTMSAMILNIFLFGMFVENVPNNMKSVMATNRNNTGKKS